MASTFPFSSLSFDLQVEVAKHWKANELGRLAQGMPNKQMRSLCETGQLWDELLRVESGRRRDYTTENLQNCYIWNAGPAASLHAHKTALAQVTVRNARKRADLTNLSGKIRYQKWKLNSGCPTVLQHIISYLDVSNMSRLARTCKGYNEQTNHMDSDNTVWKDKCEHSLKIHNKIPEHSWKETFQLVSMVAPSQRRDTFPVLFQDSTSQANKRKLETPPTTAPTKTLATSSSVTTTPTTATTATDPNVVLLMSVAGVDQATAALLLQQTNGDVNAAMSFMYD